MADIVTLANVVSVEKPVSSSKFDQSLFEGVADFGAYDAGDFQVNVLSVDHVDGVKVTLLTSMSQSKMDDASWVSVGGTSTITTGPSWVTLSVPNGGTGLLRYLRWRVEFQGFCTKVTFSITGMARRNGL